MQFSLFYLLVLSLDFAAVQAATTATVQISNGIIQGTQCNTSNAIAFLGIPYAQPPVGNLRFSPPRAYNATYAGGTLQATTSAPNCIQFGTEFLEQSSEKQSEDW